MQKDCFVLKFTVSVNNEPQRIFILKLLVFLSIILPVFTPKNKFSVRVLKCLVSDL